MTDPIPGPWSKYFPHQATTLASNPNPPIFKQAIELAEISANRRLIVSSIDPLDEGMKSALSKELFQCDQNRVGDFVIGRRIKKQLFVFHTG